MPLDLSAAARRQDSLPGRELGRIPGAALHQPRRRPTQGRLLASLLLEAELHLKVPEYALLILAQYMLPNLQSNWRPISIFWN
jgi:hypothetical protein